MDLQAILYAAVLRAKYEGTTSFTEKVVRGHAEAYLQGMLKRTRNGALPDLKDASREHMSNAMSQHLYSVLMMEPSYTFARRSYFLLLDTVRQSFLIYILLSRHFVIVVSCLRPLCKPSASSSDYAFCSQECYRVGIRH